MRIKKADIRFYELLRDFLYKYLVVQRNFPETTLNNYKESLEQFRLYLRNEKQIPFDKVSFHCFSKEIIYGFCIWLRDDKHRAAATVNLRLSAIMSFLRYCSEEDPSLSGIYLKAKSIHRFKGKDDPKLEYLRPEQLEAVFACPDITTRIGRRDQYFMIHAYETGGRVEELVEMKVGDIIRNGNSIQVRLHGKGNKTRYNPLPEEAVPHLNAYLAEFHPGGKNEDFVICSAFFCSLISRV